MSYNGGAIERSLAHSARSDQFNLVLVGGMALDSLSVFESSSIMQYVESVERFPVPLEGLWQSCGYSRKDNALKQLKVEMLEGEDFFAKLRESTGGRPSSDFFLSADAAKIFAMRARTEQGIVIARLFVAAYNELKAKLQSPPPSTVSPLDLLKVMIQQLEEQDRKQKQLESGLYALEVNQDDLRLKSLDQEKRLEGVDAELERLQSPEGHYFTILGYGMLLGVSISRKEASGLGRTASAYCRSNGLRKETVFDSSFGKIGNYPQKALQFAFREHGYISFEN